MRDVMGKAFGAAAAIACVATALSAIHSNEWWIRVLDFPRFAAIILLIIIAVGCAVTLSRWRVPVLVALATALLWQGWRVYPYVPFAPVEAAAIRPGSGVRDADCFKLLGLNVLQSNRQHDDVADLIARERPDVLLLMETDQEWARALDPVLGRYPQRLSRPLNNTYGMIFASRLPVTAAKMVNSTDRATPTLYARMATRAGREFDYIGLHPRPPRPGQDTRRRDAKIMAASRAFGATTAPVLAMGDFNDVAWSHTTRAFRQAGGFVDPRIGRGMFPTFPSGAIWLGWPLDQLFFTPDFTSRTIRIGDDVGSDHRPLIAQVCLAAPAITDSAAVR